MRWGRERESEVNSVGWFELANLSSLQWEKKMASVSASTFFYREDRDGGRDESVSPGSPRMEKR